jgi:hypothetical protein
MNFTFKQTIEMQIEIDDQVINPIIRTLSSEAHEIIKSYSSSKGSPRSWARDGLEITHVHELMSYVNESEEADSVLIISFEDGSKDFFCSTIDFQYNWSSIVDQQVLQTDTIKKSAYQEITDVKLVNVFMGICNDL